MMSGQQDRDGDGNGSGAPPGGGGSGYGMPGRPDGGPGGTMGGQGYGMPGGIPGLGQLGGGLHGSMVVPYGSGYATVAMQRGTVTQTSSSSLTVRSPDGYSATYRVTGSTQVLVPNAQGSTGTTADLSQGDAVSVIARGSTAPLSAAVVAVG
jgi:hypothetical protein